MSKSWRGKNNIPPKFPQKLYLRYGKNPCFYLEVVSTIPLEVLDINSYEQWHKKELQRLGLTSVYTVPYGERIGPELLLKIKQLPWNPKFGYKTFKSYPKYSFSGKELFQKKIQSYDNVLSKIFSVQQLLRNDRVEVFNISLGWRKLGDIINQSNEVTCREVRREKMLRGFYDDFYNRFPRFIEDICYSYLTNSTSIRNIVGINYSWMIQMMLTSMYLIPSTWR